MRGLQFAMADGAGPGHVGGSSSKTEQILALLTNGVLRFDPLDPKHPGRDRLAWSAGLGFAVLHRSCGLTTKTFVIAGDAESEEGMSYEARNLASTLAVRNLIVTLDYNHFGIDGPITEVLPSAYLNPWFSLGMQMKL